MIHAHTAKFGLGQIVRHRAQEFRGVIVDADPTYQGDPAQPGPDQPQQPYYRVLAMGQDAGFLVYAAEDVLEHDPDIGPLTREEQRRWFTVDAAGRHAPRSQPIH